MNTAAPACLLSVVRRPLFFSLAALALGGCLAGNAAALADPAAEQFWPQWRGPLGTGEAPQADPPVTWSETNNVKWKTTIPGEGDSTPIVWGGRVFLLTAIASGTNAAAPAAPQAPTEVYQFVVLCLDRASGKILWQRVARQEAPHEGHQENNTFASASPVTDGRQLLAFFGSRGLHCYDVEGNLKWEKDFGKMKTKMGFGEGASPALWGGRVVVNWDQEGEGFIAALDTASGQELWRTPRDEATGWSTPLIVECNGQRQIIVNASKKVRAYDLATGKELWSCSGQTANAIPSPVAARGVVYLTSGFRGSALQAIRLGREGDLTGTDALVWSHGKNTPYVPSPLLTDNFLYVISGNDAIVSCFDAASGRVYFEHERLEGVRGVFASPVAARDRVYILSREGACVVLKKGPEPVVLAVNKVGEDHSDASLALVDKDLFLRARRSLYCLSRP
ncbi:MAG: PQQ-binding-like beta-propeller repeat protein [Verrucomicrobiota bacterium]|jgi:outer membrane protein assembly factor BamB